MNCIPQCKNETLRPRNGLESLHNFEFHLSFDFDSMEKVWNFHRVALHDHCELFSETAHFTNQIYFHAIQRFVNRNELKLYQYIIFDVPYWKPKPLSSIRFIIGSSLFPNNTWRLEQSFGRIFWHKIWGRFNIFLSLMCDLFSSFWETNFEPKKKLETKCSNWLYASLSPLETASSKTLALNNWQ